MNNTGTDYNGGGLESGNKCHESNGKFLNVQNEEKSKLNLNRKKLWEIFQVNLLRKLCSRNRSLLIKLSIAMIHMIVLAYFSYATYYFIQSEEIGSDQLKVSNETDEFQRCKGKCGFQWCNGYGMLLILTVLTYFGIFYYSILKPTCGKWIQRNSRQFYDSLHERFKQNISTVTWVVISVSLIAFLYFETMGSEHRLVCLLGPILFIATGYIFSKDRSAIKWNLVATGIVSQFILGVICLRWSVGRQIFQCLGDKVVVFLKYSEEGSRFVFSEKLVGQGIFAFAILPVIFFFSFSISILYYLGTMQWVLTRMGWCLQMLLGTTVCESVNGAANIFLGMGESPLLIRPYIKNLTSSELHAIMASGFATVSGSVLAAYVSFGASPALLVTSTVMAAPAALAISKLFYPETEESKTKSSNIQLEKSKDSSILDAASSGASAAITMILGIIANLVAFVAFVAFLNGLMEWLGYLVGYDGITFEWLFSKLFIPLSWVLGVEWKDCDVVAKVIASKTIINEFVAYNKLGQYIRADEITHRSAGIATFAICGFANPSSLGIMIGTLSALAPERRPHITAVAIRAFVVGSVTCFISASFAGLLIPDTMLI